MSVLPAAINLDAGSLSGRAATQLESDSPSRRVAAEQDNKLARIEFLNSFIEGGSEESGEASPDSPSSLHSGDEMEVSARAKALISEEVDVTISKNAVGLDPTKHSAVVFRLNQDEPASAENSLLPSAPSGTGKSKFGKKGGE